MTEKVDADSNKRRAALDALIAFGQSAEQQALRAAERARVADAVTTLKAKYADRGLRFTTPFTGALPVQAWGHLDGLRFYFRYRWSHATLELGPYNPELDQLYARRQLEQHALRVGELEVKLAHGDADTDDLTRHITYTFVTQTEDDPAYLPLRTTFAAGVEDDEADNGFKGSLAADEDVRLFSYLAEHLRPVPEADQIPEPTRILLYQGAAALKAYWQGKGF